MGDSWRVGVDQSESTSLITHGVFSYARNPVFTGMLLVLWAVGFLVPNVVSLGGALAASVGLDLQVRLVEEPYLRTMHGEPYLRYAGRVGRFIPFIGRLRG
jgi:protein-S-isoprenylcysteine O-methyltransferase Ste14